mmetsp:Transcript_70538/g.124503  ORF Transcript_70538/g.124503 Transcript_70538/m.124503 type:complete len:279 (+) Transcript_70538:1039-1875(+)
MAHQILCIGPMLSRQWMVGKAEPVVVQTSLITRKAIGCCTSQQKCQVSMLASCAVCQLLAAQALNSVPMAVRFGFDLRASGLPPKCLATNASGTRRLRQQMGSMDGLVVAQMKRTMIRVTGPGTVPLKLRAWAPVSRRVQRCPAAKESSTAPTDVKFGLFLEASRQQSLSAASLAQSMSPSVEWMAALTVHVEVKIQTAIQATTFSTPRVWNPLMTAKHAVFRTEIAKACNMSLVAARSGRCLGELVLQRIQTVLCVFDMAPGLNPRCWTHSCPSTGA